jgi:hypothetical protein
MLSSDVNASLHLSRHHYRPIIGGSAVALLGDPEHVRLMCIVIGAMRDQCPSCVSDTLDAIALSAEAMAVTHRLEAYVHGTQPMLHGSDEADRFVAKMQHVPFPMRRQMAELSLTQLREHLDGAPPPEAII